MESLRHDQQYLSTIAMTDGPNASEAVKNDLTKAYRPYSASLSTQHTQRMKDDMEKSMQNEYTIERKASGASLTIKKRNTDE